MRRASVLALGLAMTSLPALASPVRLSDALLDAVTAGTDFAVSNLVSDQAGQAKNTDPNLVNPWGLVTSPRGTVRVADNGTGVSTSYAGDGTPQSSPAITIPAPGGGTAAPSGAVTNRTDDFTVSANGKTGRSAILFATEDGTIAGWSPSVNKSQAVIAVDQSSQGAVFKGLTLGRVGNSDELFAADFHNGKVDVFNSQFQQVGSFTDKTVPTGFAPFNVQNIQGQLYVTFAKQNSAAHDDVAGNGNGFIDVFNTSGQLQRRLVSGGPLNSPWGLTLAPKDFGAFANDLLVGNFGNGAVDAFDPKTGKFLGSLTGTNGQPLTIDGLWSLRSSQGNVLFTAGPDGEQHGLLGSISNASGSMASMSGSTNVMSSSSMMASVMSAAANAAHAGH